MKPPRGTRDEEVTNIRWMRRLEVLFALIPIRISLKMWGLSEEFINYMVYPR